jgi:transcription initiation factor IIE alpha subunit
MIPGPERSRMEREVATEMMVAAMSPISARSIQQRLERILIDDRELLISLQCQLEQIRRELRLLNDDRIVRVLSRGDRPISN